MKPAKVSRIIIASVDPEPLEEVAVSDGKRIRDTIMYLFKHSNFPSYRDIGGHFYQEWTIHVTSKVLAMKTALFDLTRYSSELDQDSIGTNIPDKFHEDKTKISPLEF
ncbi:hypothetical protein DPMN_123892 [Dreissena polymorpha]|uniref:Uncharacterized protein n=1 Tax=Dreissena polymorpha TaxID=45954 RepID=A0A9D4GR80_DREPO|nr:hypothetical protein DPMN_123892 [Dreissena polymorpha]